MISRKAERFRQAPGTGDVRYVGQHEWREFGEDWVIEESQRNRDLWFRVGRQKFRLGRLGRTQPERLDWFRTRLEAQFGTTQWLRWLRKTPKAADALRALGYDLPSTTRVWPSNSGESWRLAYYGLVCERSEYAPPGRTREELRAEAVARRYCRCRKGKQQNSAQATEADSGGAERGEVGAAAPGPGSE